MQASSLMTVVAAIFHHLTKVGYEVITPMTVQQEQLRMERGPMGLSPKDQELSLLDLNLPPVDQDRCPIYQNLSPEEQGMSHIHQKAQDTTQEDSWYSIIGNVLWFWFSIHFLWKTFQKFNSRDPTQNEEKDIFAEGSVSTKALLLNKGVLERFHEKRIHTTAHEYRRVLEFVEGFSDDLLEALRSVCDRKADIEVEDCIGVGSMYEFWRTSKPLACDLIVPFAPPEPYRFSAQLWCSPVNDTPVEHCWGRIKVERASENNSCLCSMANLGDDMLCLLHSQNEVAKISDALEDLLCSKHTPYLAKDRVIKWFQFGITKAWGQISHKYEFELTFRNLDSPGALKVRLRSGMTIIFNITPVIQFEDSDAYFVPQFTSNGGNSADARWLLSFAVYEKHLLKSLAKSLPENPCHICCLQIVSFLHKKQTGLTGTSPLSNYHLKTALLHLLLDKTPSAWSSDHLERRVCDILEFIWKSLLKRELCHVLIGNSQVPKEIGIPAVFLTAKPINLFHPLVLQRHLYTKTVKHFQEMVKNAPVLIQEYTPDFPSGNALSRLNTCPQTLVG